VDNFIDFFQSEYFVIYLFLLTSREMSSFSNPCRFLYSNFGSANLISCINSSINNRY